MKDLLRFSYCLQMSWQVEPRSTRTRLRENISQTALNVCPSSAPTTLYNMNEFILKTQSTSKNICDYYTIIQLYILLNVLVESSSVNI